MDYNKFFKRNFAEYMVYNVSSGNLDTLIQTYYKNKDYSFIEDQEMSNDSDKEFSIKKEKLNKYDEKELQIFENGECSCFITSLLLRDLCNNNIIPEGNYLVSVSW